MAGFLSKLFGGKSKEESNVQSMVKTTLEELFEKAFFDLSFELKTSQSEAGEETIKVEIFGPDEDLFKDKKGQILDAIQLFLKRVVQHNFPEDKTQITVDCGGYREESEQALIDRAENLKTIAIEQNKSVYYRALPPKERKIVHQYLAKDPRVKSRSLGDGHFKKIKIFPSKGQSNEQSRSTSQGTV